MDCTWKPIIGYESEYEINEFGMIKSLERKRKFGLQVRTINERILKQASYSNGYRFVALSRKSVVKQFMVHRLVAKHFIDNPMNLPCVNHINGDKEDNRWVNLEWVTYTENSRHFFDKLQDLPNQICPECNTTFKPNIKHQQFCSNSCKGNFRRKSLVDHEERSCENCGKSFKAWKYGKRRFCSNLCKPIPNPNGRMKTPIISHL